MSAVRILAPCLAALVAVVLCGVWPKEEPVVTGNDPQAAEQYMRGISDGKIPDPATGQYRKPYWSATAPNPAAVTRE